MERLGCLHSQEHIDMPGKSLICLRYEFKGYSDDLQREEQLRGDIASARSEVEASVESHRAALADRATLDQIQGEPPSLLRPPPC